MIGMCNIITYVGEVITDFYVRRTLCAVYQILSYATVSTMLAIYPKHSS
jgi:hypothetical protein